MSEAKRKVQAGGDPPSLDAPAKPSGVASPALPFRKGDLIFDKRDRAKTVATIITHRDLGNTGARRQWLCQYPEGRYYVWETDVVKVPA